MTFTAFKLELLPVQLNVPWCVMIYKRLFRFGLWSRSSFSPVSPWPVISKSSACCPFGSFLTNSNLPYSQKASRKDFHGPLGQALPLSSSVSLSCPVLSCTYNFQAPARHCDHPNIPGYVFEDVPTPLPLGGVGVFIDESLDCKVIEKSSN